MHKDLSWSWLCSAQDALLCDRTLALELETIEMFDFKFTAFGRLELEAGAGVV